jgi:putative endonuclease
MSADRPLKDKYLRMIRRMEETAPTGAPDPREWSVYVLRCADGSLYTGIAKNVETRLACHSSGRGASYTRSRRPLALVYREVGFSRSEALIREARIKRLPKAAKEKLIAPPAP